MKFDKVLRGKIVQDKVFEGEIGINNGKIAEIVQGKEKLKSENIYSFEEEYIFPGFIDSHVHCFSNPNEGIVTTSRSAAVGGITTIFDMPYDLPNPINSAEIFKEKVDKVNDNAVVDMCLWGTIKKRGGTDQIIPMSEEGAVAFKMSTFETDPYRFPLIPDNEILKAMQLLKEKDLIAAFHSENDSIINDLIEEYKEQNKVYAKAHNETRPPVTETSAVLKLMEFAYWTGVGLHIVHVSHPRTLDLIKQFQKQNVDVTGETCYSYLLLDVDDLEEYGPRAKINPPLREKSEVEGLWSHLQNNNIEFITSDHAPWEKEHKIKGHDNIFDAASGLPALEIMIPLLFDNIVNKRKWTPAKFAELLSTNPASRFKVPNKGMVKVGNDADLTIINPNETWTIDEETFQSYSKISPFHNKEVQGKISSTFVRGEKVYDGSKVVAKPGFGRFTPGHAYKHESSTIGTR